MQFGQQDFGALPGWQHFILPSWVALLKAYLQGGGAGGGGGGPGGGGGGGGRGCACLFVFSGPLCSNLPLDILCGNAGVPGAGSMGGGNRGANGGATILRFPNQWYAMAGGAEGGYGQRAGESPRGGRAGNVASSPDVPYYFGPGLIGQFNLHAQNGQNGCGELGGWGGATGDAGGGGRGGDKALSAGIDPTHIAQGGYVHLEFYG